MATGTNGIATSGDIDELVMGFDEWFGDYDRCPTKQQILNYPGTPSVGIHNENNYESNQLVKYSDIYEYNPTINVTFNFLYGTITGLRDSYPQQVQAFIHMDGGGWAAQDLWDTLGFIYLYGGQSSDWVPRLAGENLTFPSTVTTFEVHFDLYFEVDSGVSGYNPESKIIIRRGSNTGTIVGTWYFDIEDQGEGEYYGQIDLALPKDYTQYWLKAELTA